jgi:hypothetical protein
MVHSLRKGHTSVYFQHEHTGHSIGAEKYESEVVDGKAILRFSLRPVDGNQRFDEEYLHTHELISVDVDDSIVIDGLRNYLKSQRQELISWELQILSRGKKLSFAVEPQLIEHGARQILRLCVLVTGG